MSGICGIFRFDGTADVKRDLERQMARLTHLGPDQSRTWTGASIGLGHQLMRITREDMFDAQPLLDDELSMVADLRLDNREELAELLSIGAETLADRPDSALLMAAYKTWGADCVDHLIGDFVFAVWDARKRTLTLARDHVGQRHVFYHKGADFFAFATEIKGLWTLPEVPRLLSDANITRALMFDWSTDPGRTDYEGIWGVPGGTVMTVAADGGVVSRRYWEPRADPVHEGRDEAYYIETYRKVLTEAVQCRLRRAIRPAGLFMSGGFDSAAICALAGPVVTAQGHKLVAVSSVMPEDPGGAKSSARHWVEICRRDMPHLDVRYVTGDGLDIFSGMERSFFAMDTRHGGARYIADAIYSQVTAAGARIVMDGHGGDYTLNPRGQDALARLLRKGAFRRFVSEFRAMRRHLGQSPKQTLVRNVLIPLIPGALLRVLSRRRNGLPLFGPITPLSADIVRKYGSKTRLESDRGPRHEMEQILRIQQNFPAIGGSIPAASHGLEFTQPFHDKRVVELGLAIPEELYVRNGRARYLARAALKDLYPPEFHDRSPVNDSMVPDFLTMAKRIEPRLLAEIDRMEQSGRLSHYFDFGRMRDMLTRRTARQRAAGNSTDTHQAVNAFLVARHIEWFRGDNA